MEMASNYRPIPVLPILRKNLECPVHDQVYSYISDDEYFSGCQVRFRKRNSTGTCLIEFLDQIYTNIDKGSNTGVLFLDVHKTFNTVDHEIAFSQMSKFNSSPHVFNWFMSYLTDRSQITRINGVDSETLEIEYGVSQGSILGPHIFIMYINSLPAVLKRRQYSYANDAAIVTESDNIEAVSNTLASELNIDETWLNEHTVVKY